MTRAEAPDWDMAAWFSGPAGDDYQTFRDRLRTDVAVLGDALEGVAPPASAEAVDAFASLIVRLEDVFARTTHLASYLGCMAAADARDATVKRESAARAVQAAALEKAFVAARDALARTDDVHFARLLAHEALASAGHFVSRLRERGRVSMPASLEQLAAELGVDGLSAWSRLYDQVSGTLELELERPDGQRERHPVARTRSLLEDPDPAVRRAALAGAQRAWASVGETAAACLNAIAGTRLTLYRRRGVADVLDPALFDAAITRRTLDAMWQAVDDRIEVPRAYLRRKARLLGVERLGFADLTAPLDTRPASPITWEDACERVVDAFRGFYPDLAGFAEHAIARRWIDHGPRPGKRPGGFCSTSPVAGESRIFMTFGGAPGDVATLAHELGHAWHGWLMRDMRPFARRYPMTLAESASTFAENVLVEATLAAADGPALARTLDARLQDAATYLLDIAMRFRFERRFYAERAEGEVGVERLCALMAETQREVWGDVLDESALDPWFWASKLHFYIAGISFYNFPYTFGYLFSTGLFVRALEEGPSFLPAYEALLRSTGSAPAERVARDALGVDLEQPAFWHASLDWIEAHRIRFDAVTADARPAAG